jgi:hypothetical protein
MSYVIVEVCKKYGMKCDNAPFTAIVKNHTHTFCCQNGFERSLKEFSKTIKQRKP